MSPVRAFVVGTGSVIRRAAGVLAPALVIALVFAARAQLGLPSVGAALAPDARLGAAAAMLATSRYFFYDQYYKDFYIQAVYGFPIIYSHFSFPF